MKAAGMFWFPHLANIDMTQLLFIREREREREGNDR